MVPEVLLTDTIIGKLQNWQTTSYGTKPYSERVKTSARVFLPESRKDDNLEDEIRKQRITAGNLSIILIFGFVSKVALEFTT